MVVLYDEIEMEEKAQRLAEHLGVSCCRAWADRGTDTVDETGVAFTSDLTGTADVSDLIGSVDLADMSENNLVLHYTKDGLCLEESGHAGRSMRGDFTKMLKRLRHNNLTHETLVKASKFKDKSTDSQDNKETRSLLAIDATAGMGEDSLLLAAAGFQVILFEQDPVIAALLQDTLERSAQIPELTPIVARMTLREGDSVQEMQKMQKMQGMQEISKATGASENRPDLILLDPMFPERKKSGLIKKKFQLLQQLEKPCSNEEDLLEAAMAARPRRIVIKRPLKGPNLAGKAPSYSIKGKTIRYDCIVMG